MPRLSFTAEGLQSKEKVWRTIVHGEYIRQMILILTDNSTV